MPAVEPKDAAGGEPPLPGTCSDGAGAPRLLVVDDDAELCALLQLQLAGAGYDAACASSADAALDALRRGPAFDAALLDCVLPDGPGDALIPSLRAVDPQLPVIMMTAHGSIDGAVAAIKRGAYHYCVKPLDLSALQNLIRRALEARALRRELEAIKHEHGPPSFADLLGESPAMREVKATLAKVARSGGATTILLTGETGTGKDLAARVLHAASPRAAGPFVNVTCSAVPGGLSESELFGHERGAFTDAKERKPGLVELASGGTLFLDEVGELPVAVQAKLLRVLEERAMRRVGGVQDLHVDVRVIAATNRDLQEQIRRGRFREDLYYRLAVVPIQLPPLRERTGDVPLLADAFLRRFAAELGKPLPRLSAAARAALAAQRWPGNVRELRNAIERAVLLADAELLTPEDFAGAEPRALEGVVRLPAEGLKLDALERELVLEALTRCAGNRTRAAALLGISRDQLRYRLDKYGLRDGAPAAR